MFVPRYTEEEARDAVATSLSYAEALRKLGMSVAGGNHKVFRRYVDDIWQIPTDHFDPWTAAVRRYQPVPLRDVLVEGSNYSRSSLKRRLYEIGWKKPECEMCGQGEVWRGRRLALILDHVNGVNNDNRLENLRIVCPNCAATLDTHCGRKNELLRPEQVCPKCGGSFRPRRRDQRYCSRACGVRHSERKRGPQLSARRVARPSYAQLLEELALTNFCAVGRKYGVTDNAVRKWLRSYEQIPWVDGPVEPPQIDARPSDGPEVD